MRPMIDIGLGASSGYSLPEVTYAEEGRVERFAGLGAGVGPSLRERR